MTALPFFERPGTPAQARRRVLLLSYHFPPDTAIGARRWEKLAHFVAARGWGLDVITCAPPAGYDVAKLDALPGGVRVYGVPDVPLLIERVEDRVWRVYRRLRDHRRERREAVSGASAAPSGGGEGGGDRHGRPDMLDRAEFQWKLHTVRGALRAFWVWLDFLHTRAWTRRAERVARAIVDARTHFVVVTSGPPHQSYELGCAVAERAGLPFVMDMRDPWSLVERLPESKASRLWVWLAERHERRVIARAALVVANTEPARDAMRALYPAARERIVTVMNGSDDEPIPPPRRGGERRFTIGYAGAIYVERDPRNLFRAAARVIEELRLTPDDFGIEFMGADRPGERPLSEVARQEGVAEFVTVRPARPHAEALEFLAGATMLVIFSGWSRLAIPAKLFECVRFDAWLLSLTEEGSGPDLLLRGTAASVVRPGDVDGIAAAIRARVEEYRRGIQPVRVAQDDRFSRAGQAQILLDALARFLPQDDAARPRSALANRS
jgi:glycosyltransferase involved in cell wall biosynthesis